MPPQSKPVTLFPLPVPQTHFKHIVRKPEDREKVLKRKLPEFTSRESRARSTSADHEDEETLQTIKEDDSKDLYDSDPPVDYNHPLTFPRTNKRKRPTPKTPSLTALKAAPTKRQTHLCAINALLHRALLEKDFVRARRAFGLLCRSKDVDIRLCWKTGLQILLETTGHDTAILFLELLRIRFPYRRTLHSHHIPDETLSLLVSSVRHRIITERRLAREKRLAAVSASKSALLHPTSSPEPNLPSSPPPPANDQEALHLLLNPVQPSQQSSQSSKPRRALAAPRTIYDCSLQFAETIFELQFPPTTLSPSSRLLRVQSLKKELSETMLSPPYSDSLRCWFLLSRLNLLLCDLLRPAAPRTATERQRWEREWSVPSSMRSYGDDTVDSDQGAQWRAWKKSVDDARTAMETCEQKDVDVPEWMWEELEGLEKWRDEMGSSEVEERAVGGWVEEVGANHHGGYIHSGGAAVMGHGGYGAREPSPEIGEDVYPDMGYDDDY